MGLDEHALFLNLVEEMLMTRHDISVRILVRNHTHVPIPDVINDSPDRMN